MKPSVRRALESVSATSLEAKALTQMLLSEAAGVIDPKQQQDLVATLQTKIERLESQVDELRMSLVSVDYNIDSEAAEPGIVALYQHFKNLPVEKLVNYNKAYFQQYVPKIRVIVATVLINVASEKQKQPMQFWLDLVASNGEF